MERPYTDVFRQPGKMENAVSVLVIGWERKNGVKIMPALFESTPYTMTAFLDIMESRQPHRYSSHNLGAVLDSLHPRPRALVVGPAVDPALNTDLEIVWSNYVREVLEKEGAQEGEVNTLKSALVLVCPDFDSEELF